MVRRAVAIVVAVIAMAAAKPARAQLHVRLSTPATIVGDGTTRSTLKLLSDDPAALARFTLDVDAGTVGERRVVAGGVEIDYVAPRVALPRDVHVAVASGGSIVSQPVAISVTPPPRPRQHAESAGPLALAAPATLVLGEDDAADILVRAASPPSLSANVGTIAPPVADGHGGWRARYTPPPQHFPQVAIIAAAGAGQVDWISIPLYGVGRVETRTKPNARITLALGEVVFGPFRTDASGAATTPVVAPPGVHRGSTHAVDALGNAKDTPFDLATPPASRLGVLCVGDTLHVFVADEHGAAAGATEKIALTASTGSLDAATSLGAGHWAARWRPGTEAEADLTAALEGEPASRASCRARRAAAVPVAVELSADRREAVAGAPPLLLRARVRFAGGGAAARVPITFDADVGRVEIDPDTDGDAPDVVRARWILPTQLSGRASAMVTAKIATAGQEAGARGTATATLTVKLVAGPPAHVRLAAAPRWLLADGSHARLAVRVTDAWGNPVAPERLVARARGRSFAVRDDGSLDYVAPRSRRAVDDVLELRDRDGDGGAVVVRLRPPPRPFSLGARLGWLGNFGKLSSAFVALDADWHPRFVHRRFSLGVSAGVFPAAYQTSDSATGARVALAVTGVPLLARVGYAQPIGRAALYGGVGGGVVLARVQSSSSLAGTSGGTDALGAFEAHLGGDVALGFGRVALEVGYLYAPATSGSIRGNFGGLAVTAGYRVGL